MPINIQEKKEETKEDITEKDLIMKRMENAEKLKKAKVNSRKNIPSMPTRKMSRAGGLPMAAPTPVDTTSAFGPMRLSSYDRRQLILDMPNKADANQETKSDGSNE